MSFQRLFIAFFCQGSIIKVCSVQLGNLEGVTNYKRLAQPFANLVIIRFWQKLHRTIFRCRLIWGKVSLRSLGLPFRQTYIRLPPQSSGILLLTSAGCAIQTPETSYISKTSALGQRPLSQWDNCMIVFKTKICVILLHQSCLF